MATSLAVTAYELPTIALEGIRAMASEPLSKLRRNTLFMVPTLCEQLSLSSQIRYRPSVSFIKEVQRFAPTEWHAMSTNACALNGV